MVITLLYACQPQPVDVRISPEALAPIDDNMFGQFLEKASWDNEIGGDVLIDTATGQLIPQALAYLQAMNIPVIRFPGGTDADYYPWYFLIDNAPGTNGLRSPYKAFCRDSATVSDNRMGLDEFMQLCDTLGSEPLLVVNMGEAFLGRKSLETIASDAANFVAYCNRPVAANPAKGTTDWAAIRALNGHPAPYRVKFWEVGNEPWLWKGLSMDCTDSVMVERYLSMLEVVIDAMRAVDSTIVIIADGGIKGVNAKLKKRLGNKLDMVAFHPYKPWAIKSVLQGTDTVDLATITDEMAWNAWVSVPSSDTVTGFSSISTDGYYQSVVNTGYPIAVTEWNWNGWWQLPEGIKEPYGTKFAKGVGATGYLHAMMREGARIRMGCQSMLAGKGWGITAIRIDDEGIRHFPTGKVTGMYATWHGNVLMKSEVTNNPSYSQPFTMNALHPSPKVAVLDVVATGTDSTVFIHIINRSFTDDVTVRLTFDSLSIADQAIVHSLVQTDDDLGRIIDTAADLAKSRNRITLPAQSVNIIEVKIE